MAPLGICANEKLSIVLLQYQIPPLLSPVPKNEKVYVSKEVHPLPAPLDKHLPELPVPLTWNVVELSPIVKLLNKTFVLITYDILSSIVL